MQEREGKVLPMVRTIPEKRWREIEKDLYGRSFVTIRPRQTSSKAAPANTSAEETLRDGRDHTEE